MRIIHFTQGATDELSGFRALGVSSVPLADGSGDTHVTCLHFGPGAKILAPPVTHDSALLIVSGSVEVVFDAGGRAHLSAGMGVVIDAGQHYSLESPTGAIAIAVESQRLQATARAIATPRPHHGPTLAR
jgi:mannose-6-phosphate isomerase-like protein (cupin superfamily)